MNWLFMFTFIGVLLVPVFLAGYGFGWGMRGEQEAIYDENDAERAASMRRHPAGKRLRVVRPEDPA